MKRIMFYLIAATLLITLIVSCAAPASSPTSAPGPTQAPKPASAPTTAAPAPVASPTSGQQAEPVVLKALAYLPLNHNTIKGAMIFSDMIKQATNGEVTIKWVGGPEVMAESEQIEAVKTGVADMVCYATAYYEKNIPEVKALSMSQILPAEEKQRGFNDLMIESHKKLGVYFLGRSVVQSDPSFYFFTNKAIKSLTEYKGMKFRAGTIYQPLMNALGIVPVTVSNTETYSAMERGLVDAWASTPSTCLQFKLQEVTKYVDPPGFYTSNTSILIRQQTWDKLPKRLQTLMTDTLDAALKGPIFDFYQDNAGVTWKKMIAAGVTVNELPPAESAKFLEIAYSSVWKDLEKNVSPDMLAKLKTMLSK